MSTSDLASVPWTVLREWPGRWRYPVLAITVDSDDDDGSPQGTADLILQGLADPRAPEQVADELVANGEFGLAEDLRNQADLPAAVIEKLNHTIARAREEVAIQVGDRIAGLRRRAQQVGAEFSLDQEQLIESAQMRKGPVLVELIAEERMIAAAERECATTLRRRAEEKISQFGGDGSAWLDSVHTCIGSREFAAARRLLETGPSELPGERPLSVPRPRQAWPFPGFSLQDVLSWYDGEPGQAAGFERWLPAEGDEAAIRLITSLRSLTDGIGVHSVLDFVLALHALLGEDSPQCPIRQVGQGVLTSLGIPAVYPLPSTPLTSTQGVALWVADAGDLPPEDVRPLIWFVPAVQAVQLAPWGIARLDATDVLRLVPVPQTGDATQFRSMNLLRAVASRLPAEDFLGRLRIAHTPAETEVDWALDLAGIHPDAACLQAIQAEIADQPALLRRLLVRLADDPQPGEPRRQRLGLAALNRIRHSPEWRDEALTALLLPLRHDDDARLLLRIVTAFYPHTGVTFTASQLEQYAAQALGSGGVITAELLQGAISRLVTDRLLERAGPDEFRLPANRIGELLTPAVPEQALTEAHAAIAELKAIHQGAGEADANGVIRFIGHQVDGDLVGIKTELDGLLQTPADQQELRIGRASAYAEDASGVYRKYRQAMADVSPCPLYQVLMECGAITESLSHGTVRVPEVSGPRDLQVRANVWLLREAFRAILDNSRQELHRARQQFGTINLQVRRDAQGPPGTQNGEDRSWALTVIEDTGGGMDEETHAGLTGGARQGIEPRGHGTGLEMARRWFAEFGGYLDIPSASQPLSGAQVRVWLPVHEG